MRRGGDPSWKGAPWEPRAGAGRLLGKEGGGGGVGSLVPGPLTALGSRWPQPPSSLSSSSCICFGSMGGGGGGRHSGPLPRSALGGGSLESGRLYFSDPDCRAPSSGALVRRPRVGRDTSLFFLSTGPFDMEWGFGGLSGHHPRPAPSLTGQPSWRKGAIEPPRLRGGTGQHRPWPQTEPDGPQLCSHVTGDGLSPLRRLLSQASPYPCVTAWL